MGETFTLKVSVKNRFTQTLLEFECVTSRFLDDVTLGQDHSVGFWIVHEFSFVVGLSLFFIIMMLRNTFSIFIYIRIWLPLWWLNLIDEFFILCKLSSWYKNFNCWEFAVFLDWIIFLLRSFFFILVVTWPILLAVFFFSNFLTFIWPRLFWVSFIFLLRNTDFFLFLDIADVFLSFYFFCFA